MSPEENKPLTKLLIPVIKILRRRALAVDQTHQANLQLVIPNYLPRIQYYLLNARKLLAITAFPEIMNFGKAKGGWMKIKSLAIVLPLLFLILTGCIPPTVEEAQVEFCQALVAYGESVQVLQEINADTTVGEMRTARDNVAAARQDVTDSAGALREAKLNRVEMAWENVQREISSVPGEATLDEAAASIRGPVLVLATEIERARNISCGRR